MREMKDSGIEWIGEIPIDWDVVRLKNKWTNKKEIAGSLAEEYPRLALTLNGIVERPKDDVDGLQPKDFLSYQIVRKNDLLFKMIDLKNFSTSRVGLSSYTGLVSPAYLRFVPSSDVTCFEFTYYFLMSLYYFHVYNSLGDDGVRSSLSSSDMGNLCIPWPSLPEQQAIACFLDIKCSEIDALSSDIQSQIDMLEQYKRSVISEAVTKGLDPNVPMKDSGMSFIGYIPSNWQIDKIKYHLFRYEMRNPGNKQILSVYREYGVIPKDSRDDNHNVTSEDTSKYKYVIPGYFVINKMKAWQGSMGISDYEGVVSPAYYVYKFIDNAFCHKYFHYLLRAVYKDEFRRLSGGIREGQWDLPAYSFENTRVLIPAYPEQQAIADYLDAKCSEIDQVIAQKQEQLATLAEYKKSLIYEYVTGKKEVPVS